MKNDIADILFKYTTGEATLEETNDALKEAEAGFNLEPGRNEITPTRWPSPLSEIPRRGQRLRPVGHRYRQHGESPRHQRQAGRAINQVSHDGTTNMLAFVIIGPNRYEVKGDTLTDC